LARWYEDYLSTGPKPIFILPVYFQQVAPSDGNELSRNACSLGQLLAYFAKLGTIGFGGPIALAGAMQRDLVDRMQWISLQEYKEGLALSQLAPGPLAAQLAIYLGWVRFGVPGATLVAFTFVIPSLLMVLGLAALYIRFGGLPWMQEFSTVLARQSSA
jgi:chromate transporter